MEIHVPPYESIPFDRRVLVDFQKCYSEFPDNYFCIDLETTGLDRKSDRINQIAILPVKNRKPQLVRSFVINWTIGMSDVEVYDWSQRLSKTRAVMESKGKNYPWNIDLIRRAGRPTDEVVRQISDVLGNDPFCVAHYGWNFDFPWLFDFMKANRSDFSVDVNRLYDTCLTTKAALAFMSPTIMRPTIQKWYDEVNRQRVHIGCKLEDCVDRFGLARSGVKAASMHMADYDAWCAHLIFEKHREVAACPE